MTKNICTTQYEAKEIVVPGIAQPHGNNYPHALAFKDLLILSGVGPREADSKTFSISFEGQCQQTLANVDAILKHARSELGSDVKMVDVMIYFLDIGGLKYFETEFHKQFPDENPNLDSIEVAALPGNIAIEMKVHARILRQDGVMVKDRDLEFVSTETRGKSTLPSGDFRSQCDDVFENLETELKRKGLTKSNILEVEVHMRDIHMKPNDWNTYNDLYRTRFEDL
jgi:enamine deaminase RidA (YjgF/YER057c/UK114 family)